MLVEECYEILARVAFASCKDKDSELITLEAEITDDMTTLKSCY